MRKDDIDKDLLSKYLERNFKLHRLKKDGKFRSSIIIDSLSFPINEKKLHNIILEKLFMILKLSIQPNNDNLILDVIKSQYPILFKK
jgi:hypothetical protein